MSVLRDMITEPRSSKKLFCMTYKYSYFHLIFGLKVLTLKLNDRIQVFDWKAFSFEEIFARNLA